MAEFIADKTQPGPGAPIDKASSEPKLDANTVEWKVDELLAAMTNKSAGGTCPAVDKVVNDISAKDRSGIIELAGQIYTKDYTYSHDNMKQADFKAGEPIQAAVLRDGNPNKEVTFFKQDSPMAVNGIKIEGDDGKLHTVFHEIYDPKNNVVLEANKCS